MRVREHELDDADGQRGNQGLVVAVTNNTEVPGGQQPQELPEPELSRTFLRPSRVFVGELRGALSGETG